MSDWRRRDVLRLGLTLLGAGASMRPAELAAALASSPATPPRARFVVLCELTGGLDTLAWLAPAADPAYTRLRARLAWRTADGWDVGGGLFLRDHLRALQPVASAGELAVVGPIGPQRHERSHFRARDLWSWGPDATPGGEGLLGRRLHRAAGRVAEVWVGQSDAAALHGGRVIGFGHPDGALRPRRSSPTPGPDHGAAARTPAAAAAMAHLLTVQRDLHAAEAELARRLGAVERPPGAPRTPIGAQVEMVAWLLAAGLHAPCFAIALDGFDTHALQAQKLAGRLPMLAEALAWLRTELQRQDRWQDARVLTWTEFGRRAGENASGGTDHGGGAFALALGAGVHGGVHSALAGAGGAAKIGLNALDQGDLPRVLGPESVWSTVAAYLGPRQVRPLPGEPAPLAAVIGTVG
ncbi:MAG: DUF1501 domain-containing protein [Deltaproteobacteria bacterium]|nr:DUF1501 domain-containing protein [Deltaproteobacteria bacterium]